MKNLTWSLLITLIFTTGFISCRETPQKGTTQDVVEDLDDVMQRAEDDVKVMIKKDSTNNKELKNLE